MRQEMPLSNDEKWTPHLPRGTPAPPEQQANVLVTSVHLHVICLSTTGLCTPIVTPTFLVPSKQWKRTSTALRVSLQHVDSTRIVPLFFALYLNRWFLTSKNVQLGPECILSPDQLACLGVTCGDFSVPNPTIITHYGILTQTFWAFGKLKKHREDPLSREVMRRGAGQESQALGSENKQGVWGRLGVGGSLWTLKCSSCALSLRLRIKQRIWDRQTLA